MNYPQNFVFKFSFEDDQEETWFFPIVNGPQSHILELIEDENSNNWERIMWELETEYGIHDVGYNSEKEFLGFTTYEVSRDKVLPLMNEWIKVFNSYDFECGEISKVEV